jgi:tyrosyl-tRNA synthetase
LGLSPREQLHVIESGSAAIVPDEALAEKLGRGEALVVKLGVDPTAPDLHLGHAVSLRKLRQFQDLGHRVVLIIGDFTALVGDPSGRTSTRPPLTTEEIEANAETYVDQAFRILDPEKTELRRNSEWLGTLDFADILGLASRFTVARILERDDFAKRYEAQQSISLHEFLYPMMQAYDSVAIEADVELGGTDQLFNLLAGRELMEKLDMEPQVCLTLPLLEGTDGVQKMSKSYGNYVGLTDEPDDMFGKVMSVPDELIVKYYRLATSVPVDEVDGIEAGLSDGTLHPNQTKRRLAREIVALYHDEAAARSAEEAFDRVFKRHEAPEDIARHPILDSYWASPDEGSDSDAPMVSLAATFTDVGLTASGSAARRLIDEGAVRIDGQQLAAGTRNIPLDEIADKNVQIGKRRWALFYLDE